MASNFFDEVFSGTFSSQQPTRLIPYISEGLNGKVSTIDPERIVALECFIDLLGITSDSFALACLGITHHQVPETHGIVDLCVDSQVIQLQELEAQAALPIKLQFSTSGASGVSRCTFA